MSEEQFPNTTKMDTCCCQAKIDKLEETVETLKLHLQEKDNDFQNWKNIVQKVVLQKLNFDIEKEVIAESGQLSCTHNIEEGRLILSPSDPSSSGKGPSTMSPTHVFDDLNKTLEHILLSSVKKSTNEEMKGIAPVSRPPVIVSNSMDSCDLDPAVIVLSTSATLDRGTTKNVQCEISNKRPASAPNPDLRSPSSGMNNSANTDDSSIFRISKLFPLQEITIAPVSHTITDNHNSKAGSSSQSMRPNILRKRKTNYESSSSKSNSKRADVNLDDEGLWRKWTPDLDEGHVEESSCSNNQTKTATNSCNSVNVDKRIQLENFGVSVSLMENPGDSVERNCRNARNRIRDDSLIDITESSNRTFNSFSKSQGNTEHANILISQARSHSSDTSESASSHDDEDMENVDVHIKTVDYEIIDLDSDSSDDTHELYTNSALQDHLDANEILNTEDSSDVSQDVESADSTEDSEESRKQKMEMFGSEHFVNRALRTHGFRNKLLESAMINWQKALLEQDKEAVEIKRKAAKTAIVLDGQKKIYRCSVCEASLTNSYDRALKHAQSHFVKRSYKCEICGYKKSCRTTFLDHYKKPEYLGCFKRLAFDIYDKNDFASESRSSFKTIKPKRKLVDLKKLKNCKKLKWETFVKIVRCPLTDTFGLQYIELEEKLKAINNELEKFSKLAKL